MRTLTATFQIVTPMFLGGADPRTPQGIRPASVKGALRFWWRALNWADALAQRGPDPCAALQHLHQRESQLFGRSGTESGGGGQGVFLMQIIDRAGAAREQPFGSGFDNGILYLLGMGLGHYGDGNHCLRAALPMGKGFDLRLLFRPGVADEDIASVAQAVQVFGLLGALGSRARHGMGSVALTHWQAQGIDLGGWAPPTTVQTYGAALRALLAPARLAPGLPPLSAFSAGSRVDLSMRRAGAAAATDLLAAIGREQQAYRSFGQNGKVNGQPSERNFVPDHDLARSVADGARTVAAAPKRAVFGLPHNYFFSSDKSKVDINYSPGGEEARRASPLLLHLHPLPGDGCTVAVHTLLQSRFLPEGSQTVTFKPGRARAIDKVPVDPDWSVLTTYLDRYPQRFAADWVSL